MEQKYRKLETGDTIQDGDEVWEFGCGPWGPVSKIEHGQQYRNGYNEMRRPVAAEETIDDVREAWQKDHMEMKRKLDAVVAERMGIERMWFKQRDELSDSRNQINDLTKKLEDVVERGLRYGFELADARNQITDLTRRLEDALSDKVIAEVEVSRFVRTITKSFGWAEHVKDLDLISGQVVEIVEREAALWDYADAARQVIPDLQKKITDLTRRLEDALSEKVIAEKSYHEARVERDQAVKDVFAYAGFTRSIAVELGLGTMEISFKEVITSVKQLYKDLGNISTTLMKANSEIHDLKINLDNAMRSMVSDEAKFADKNTTIRRLKEKLENLEYHVENEHVASWRKIQEVLPESMEGSLVNQIIGYMHQLARERDNWMETAAQHSRNQEFYHGLVTDIGNMFGLRARISDDGTICEGVLALRVPELVAELIVENS